MQVFHLKWKIIVYKFIVTICTPSIIVFLILYLYYYYYYISYNPQQTCHVSAIICSFYLQMGSLPSSESWLIHWWQHKRTGTQSHKYVDNHSSVLATQRNIFNMYLWCIHNFNTFWKVSILFWEFPKKLKVAVEIFMLMKSCQMKNNDGVEVTYLNISDAVGNLLFQILNYPIKFD